MSSGTSGSLYDLTGNKIENTYGRLVQAIPPSSGANDPRTSTIFYDGYGNIITSLNVTSSFAISASYAISASVEILKEISSSHADTASYVNPLNQDVLINGNLNVTGSFTASGLNYPTVDGNRAETIITDGAGNLSFGLPEKLHLQVRNDDSVDIIAGTPIYSTGEIGGSERIKVRIAQASDSSKMPAIGIVETTLTTTGDTKDGFAVINGIYNTNVTPVSGTPALGDNIYVHANGGLTTIKPSGSNLIQNIGTVLKVGGGQIQGMKVSSIDRTNDVPNLLTGNVFYGVGDQATQSPLSDIISGSLFSYSGSFSGSFQGDGSGLTGITAVADTGSLLTTASFSDPNLTFTKGDSSTFDVDLTSLTVATASYALNSELLDGRDSTTFTSTSSFNLFTSSYYTDSASFDIRITNNSSSIAILSSSYLTTSASFANDILTNSSSIALLSSSFLTFSASYNTGSFTGSFLGEATLDSLIVNGPLTFKTYRLTSSTYTASLNDYRIGVKYTLTGSVEIQLPLIATAGEIEYRFKDEEGNANINNITIIASGSDLIDGDANAIMNRNYIGIGVYNDGISNWFIE